MNVERIRTLTAIQLPLLKYVNVKLDLNLLKVLANVQQMVTYPKMAFVKLVSNSYHM